jgi:hypothetical protein
MKAKVLFFLLAVFLLGISLPVQKILSESFGESAKRLSDEDSISSELRPSAHYATKFAVSAPVGSFGPAQPEADKQSSKLGRAEEQNQHREIKNRLPFRKEVPSVKHDTDAALADFLLEPMPAPLLTFDGLNSNDNASAYGFRVIPPDTTGDVGPNHYVQAVNLLVRVFDKQGAPVTPPFKMSSVFAALNTTCASRNDGDVLVMYDALADRWVLSQFCTFSPPFRQMVAVSQTGDPTGSYFVYEFVMPNFKLNDYPKMGVWTDAYYMTTDQFLGSDYAGTGAFAFDREKMLAGNPNAGFIYFDLASPSTIRLGGMLPSDLDGIVPPPPFTPNVFLGYTATEYGEPADTLRLFDFRPNFQNPSASTFTERIGSPLAVAPFDPTSPPDRQDIPQPAPGELLDSQSDRLMYRLAYRNFGGFDSLVVNQTVKVSQPGEFYRAGVRFYELQRSLLVATPISPFVVKNQATIGGTDVSRWMGSAAQDNQGNIAVGYNTASLEKKPNLVYSGRAASDAPNTIREEQTLFAGTGVQTAFGFRWGDYSSMTIDPQDDCTFWYTNEYFSAESQEESPFGWKTRIGKFKFPTCTNVQSGVIQGIVTNAANGQPIANAVLKTANGYSRVSANNGNYGFTVFPGSYSITISANGFRSQTVTVNVGNGGNVTQNFALQPTAVLENLGLDITTESCARNFAIEPGETVTVNLPLRNTGALATTNLTATLLSTGGVTNPGAAQNYGTLAVNSFAVRPFTFTASSALNCGSSLTLTFQLNDGAENLGTVTQTFNAGAVKVALREGFSGTALPNGWTTAASGAQQIWQSVLIEPTQNNYAAFSDEAIQPGVNELVSPPIAIQSNQAKLSFNNKYELESTFLRNQLYDGGVLEIKIGNGEFQDILAAGGTFTSGGYDGPLSSCCQNPLAGRHAWSSRSGIGAEPVFITSSVNLPAAAQGQNIQLRWRVATDIGNRRQGQWIDNIEVTDGFTCSCTTAPRRANYDFEGDGRTDLSVFRQINNRGIWIINQSSNNSVQPFQWGLNTDKITPADYDGDGKTDLAVFRPENGNWFVLRSGNNTIDFRVFGQSNDIPAPADVDGDSKADFAVFRPNNGVWYVLNNANNQFSAFQFGTNGDVPTPRDFDGDGKADIAVWRPDTGVWYVRRTTDNGFTIVQFGLNGDTPTAADYDGDGKADFAVFRPTNRTWYLLQSTTGFFALEYGLTGDIPVAGDYDGDGKTDIAVWRPTSTVWYIRRSSDNVTNFAQFGTNGDLPVPAAYIP